jgi:hypothetical protein
MTCCHMSKVLSAYFDSMTYVDIQKLSFTLNPDESFMKS